MKFDEYQRRWEIERAHEDAILENFWRDLRRPFIPILVWLCGPRWHRWLFACVYLVLLAAVLTWGVVTR